MGQQLNTTDLEYGHCNIQPQRHYSSRTDDVQIVVSHGSENNERAATEEARAVQAKAASLKCITDNNDGSKGLEDDAETLDEMEVP